MAKATINTQRRAIVDMRPYRGETRQPARHETAWAYKGRDVTSQWSGDGWRHAGTFPYGTVLMVGRDAAGWYRRATGMTARDVGVTGVMRDRDGTWWTNAANPGDIGAVYYLAERE